MCFMNYSQKYYITNDGTPMPGCCSVHLIPAKLCSK